MPAARFPMMLVSKELNENRGVKGEAKGKHMVDFVTTIVVGAKRFGFIGLPGVLSCNFSVRNDITLGAPSFIQK